jgi:NADH-quinone oxidoreductase subunit N
MSAIILSAIWGVVMMFSGIFMKSGSAVRTTAIVGLLILLIANAYFSALLLFKPKLTKLS